MIEEPLSRTLSLSPAELSSGDIVLPDTERLEPDFRRSAPDFGTFTQRDDGGNGRFVEDFHFRTVVSVFGRCSLSKMTEILFWQEVFECDEDAVQYQTLHDPPQLEPSDAWGLQERGFKGRQKGQEAVLPAQGVAHIAVRRHSGPATLQQPPGGGGPAAGRKSATLAAPRQVLLLFSF
ncbi:hypothetical protein NPIL_41271 [Nephila pilipes]|uniref:Uncharacterized protein n=1 Tax=Nephila pilipes TaxID=299642 RepID=A0A8X6Q7E4_NEPPI|nr:hypothetical protein NPIL_41271 [Nephila pilipes]